MIQKLGIADVQKCGGSRDEKKRRSLGLKSCLPTAPVLPIIWNEKFGTFSF
jgi:hypothetical protein